ncbi:nucleotidyltransferase domain-containing protein [Geminocystis sp. CENA526]|uniref:nucleotidyltransferase domain-containing protein n=1 Tax=Geminocystis sp. CENA526 TaxID=1355871 RepID=UPI003D6F0CEC
MIVQLKENTKYFILDDLEKNVLNILKTFFIELYKEKLDKIILFGSRARGDDRPDSDYDILIVLKTDFNYSEEIDKTSKFISNISLTYDIVISRGFTNSFDYVNSNSPFFLNIRKEGIIL